MAVEARRSPGSPIIACTTPTPTRRAIRTPAPRRRRSSKACGTPTALADEDPARPVQYHRPLRGQGHALDEPRLPVLVGLALAIPFVLGFRPARLLDTATLDPAVGQLRADLLHPPRRVVDRLGLRLLRPPRTSTSRGCRRRRLAGDPEFGEPGTTTANVPAFRAPGLGQFEVDTLGDADTAMRGWGSRNMVGVAPERRQAKLMAPAPRGDHRGRLIDQAFMRRTVHVAHRLRRSRRSARSKLTLGPLLPRRRRRPRSGH